jgi:hypothetical protein
MASISAADGYRLFHEGPGTGALDDAASAGRDLLGRYNDRMNQVSSLVQGIGGSWTGDAADSAQAGALPLVRSLQQSHDALTTTQDLMARQSGSFHDGARSVQQVPDEAPSPSIGDFLPPWSGSYSDKVNSYVDKAQGNVTAMQNYGNATGFNNGGTPTAYGGVTGGGSDITIAPDQGTGGTDGSQPGTGGGSQYQHHQTGGGGYTPSGNYSGGPVGGGSPYQGGPTGGSGGQPGGGSTGPGSTTSQQGWQGGVPGQVSGYGTPGYGQPGSGSSFGPGSGGEFGGGFGPVGGGFGGADSVAGGGSGRGGTGGGRGFGAGGSGAGAQGGNQPGAGNRAGVGGMPGEGGPGAAAVGRPGAAGASGAGGMAGAAGGKGGKKSEDSEHKSAAYLEDDYSDDIVGELPRAVPPVIGLS